MSTGTLAPAEVVYPDRDGKPMSDNMLQFHWITMLQGNLAGVFRDAPDVFVAGNNLIYAQQGNPKRRAAPDVYVAFGRPRHDRGSYQVWNEGGVFPHVIFEVLSPGNRLGEMARKLMFYERYGAEEYYVYDPGDVDLVAYRRGPRGRLRPVRDPDGFVSPRLGVRFDLSGEDMVVFDPAGRPFRTVAELNAENAALLARAEAADARAAREAADNARLRELLKTAGLDTEGVS